MTIATAERQPIVALDSEHDAIGLIERALEGVHGSSARLVAPDGSATDLPASLYSVLVRAAHELARGRGVAILPVGMELTTQQAAEMLNVSRPHLIKMLGAGAVPFHMVGTHRRIRLDDLMTYRGARSASRREALKRLTVEAQELGLDDE